MRRLGQRRRTAITRHEAQEICQRWEGKGTQPGLGRLGKDFSRLAYGATNGKRKRFSAIDLLSEGHGTSKAIE